MRAGAGTRGDETSLAARIAPAATAGERGYAVERRQTRPGALPELCPADVLVCAHVGAPTRLDWRVPGERPGGRVVGPGEVTVTGADVPRTLCAGGASDIVLVAIAPALLATAAAAAGVRAPALPAWHTRVDPRAFHTALALAGDGTSAGGPLATDVATRLAADALAHALALHLVGGHAAARGEADAARAAPRALAPARLRRALDYIDAHLAGDLALADVAAAAHASPFHFARLFRRATGTSVHRYVTARRVARARHLLAATELPVGHVGALVGFGSPSYFAAVFRRATGGPPQAYRHACGRANSRTGDGPDEGAGTA